MSREILLKMKFYLILDFILCILSTTSAGFFEGFLRQGDACFPVVDSPPVCNETLAQSYQPGIQTAGGSEPNTLAFLFTSASPDRAEQLHLCGGRLPPGSTYNPADNTEIFTHGWLDGLCRTAWMREAKEQIFARGKFNVILIDWTWGNGPDRDIGVQNCRIVGEQIGFIINNIMQQTGAGPEKFHLIGHSLGAIVSGFAGRALDGELRRITALDPSYGSFENVPPEERITYRDARLVDVIHTNGGNCSTTHSGDIRDLGHADFYPNGGTQQAGCYYAMMEAFLKGDYLNAFFSLLPRFCSHVQAIQYYKLSINPGNCEYVGIESDSYEEFQAMKGTDDYEWAVMGMNYEMYRSTNDESRRKYYLETTNRCPYYDGSYLGNMEFPFETSCTA